MREHHPLTDIQPQDQARIECLSDWLAAKLQGAAVRLGSQSGMKFHGERCQILGQSIEAEP